MAWFSLPCAYLPSFLFLFLSVCAVVALCQDVVIRYPATDPRGRQVSAIGAALHYPSYLEDSGPDYEAEMRYYHGDTLSPKDKVNHIAYISPQQGYITVAMQCPEHVNHCDGGALIQEKVNHITYILPLQGYTCHISLWQYSVTNMLIITINGTLTFGT